MDMRDPNRNYRKRDKNSPTAPPRPHRTGILPGVPDNWKEKQPAAQCCTSRELRPADALRAGLSTAAPAEQLRGRILIE